MLKPFLAGATMLASVVIAMFFLRFKKTSRDRLFGFFALAFLLLGLERVAMEFISDGPRSLLYLIRLLAFVIMLYAIADKNRRGKKS
jgi:lipopolysaccharide export LptBFGC system permease protein LptF